VGVYVSNEEKAFWVFDGTGSNYMNWFSQSRLLESSYTDISATTGNPNYFSIIGSALP
jgi:hypothetical protein